MRGNASAPMSLHNVTVGADRALSASGKGLDMMLGIVLPAFQVGSAAVGDRHRRGGRAGDDPARDAGAARAPEQLARGAANAARPIARMRIETDRARAHLGAVLDSLEAPGPATQLMVLEAKAAATEAAVA